MRQIKRIPIVLKHLDIPAFISSFGVHPDEEIDELKIKCSSSLEEIEMFWNENPDLRLTQVLVHLGIISNVPGFWYYNEECDWMIDNGIIALEEICFWGVNYTKENIKLPGTEWSLLKDLDIDHIRAILANVPTINHQYRQYFKRRILAANFESTEKIINNLNNNDNV